MLFFFYGTLVAGHQNHASERVHARLRPLGPATVRGQLHVIEDSGGWYPALTEGEKAVQGQIYEALPTFGADDLAALDAYESVEYERRETAIMGSNLRAQAYWWQGPVPAGAPAIEDGDFSAWLARTGVPAYR